MTIQWLAWQVKYVGVPSKPPDISRERWHGMLLCVYNFLKTESIM